MTHENKFSLPKKMLTVSVNDFMPTSAALVGQGKDVDVEFTEPGGLRQSHPHCPPYQVTLPMSQFSFPVPELSCLESDLAHSRQKPTCEPNPGSVDSQGV